MSCDETTGWVQCNRCNKWRKLGASTAQSHLPDVWFCENNTWAPQFANCNVPEETEEQPSMTAANRPRIEVKMPRKVSPSSSALSRKASSAKKSPSQNKSTAVRRSPSTDHPPPPSSSSPTSEKEDSERAPLKLPPLEQEPEVPVKTALMNHVKLMNEMLQVVLPGFSSGESEDPQMTLFLKVQEITSKIKNITRSTKATEKLNESWLPTQLVDQVDTMENNPQLYAYSEYSRMQGLAKQVDQSEKRYKQMYQEGSILLEEHRKASLDS